MKNICVLEQADTRHVREFAVRGLGSADHRKTAVFGSFRGPARAATVQIDRPAAARRQRIVLAALCAHTNISSNDNTASDDRFFVFFFTRFRPPFRRRRRRRENSDSTLLASVRETCRFSDTRPCLRRPAAPTGTGRSAGTCTRRRSRRSLCTARLRGRRKWGKKNIRVSVVIGGFGSSHRLSGPTGRRDARKSNSTAARDVWTSRGNETRPDDESTRGHCGTVTRTCNAVETTESGAECRIRGGNEPVRRSTTVGKARKSSFANGLTRRTG